MAALAPILTEARKTTATNAFVILDSALPPIDQIATGWPFYSGKHKKHGINVQVITDPARRLLWATPALPGAVHGIFDALKEADGQCWADKGYRWRRQHRTPAVPGAAGKRSPQASKPLTARTRRSAYLPNRRWPPSRPGGFYKPRCSTARTTNLVHVILTLHLTCPN
ncbi:hypothetical protein GCM10009802_07220 [Streptomyces synnematoformans]|uniref:DDE Tnp4 domain-containing protein n=1 Tax=Streptomyces synnematoformans TaxID=415721 RepID=A0ABN2XDV5_9ACTN